MRNFFSYFKSRQFFIHLLFALLVVTGLFFATAKWLNSYTRHGQFVVVPDFTGKRLSQLEAFGRDQVVSYEIIDSLYDPAQKPGLVLRQDPEPSSKVKYNRTVYLYVTGMVPPKTEMPLLLDRSERQARLIIETYGLKVGRVTQREADCNGCVLAQEWKGTPIEAGTKIKKGSVIDLVVGTKDAFIGQHASDTSSTN